MNHEPETSPDTEPERPPPDPEVQLLIQQLQAAHKRVNELAHAVQAGERDRAEFKERLTRERERMLDVEKGKVAVTLLEAVDQLDLCLQAADSSPLAKGVKLIRESILKQAEGVGIERVELTGHPFDPNFAEASDMELTTTPEEDGRVVLVLKAAYQLNGRVIRPGVVKVAKYVKAARA
jgi:molecular chaperone GrpE